VSAVSVLASLQQVQNQIASMFPNGATPSGINDQATLNSFQQILASLSPNGTSSAGGILGLTASTASGIATTTGTTGTAGTTDDGSVTGSDVVADAEKYLGVPYVLDGESTSGIDCSGLVQKTYADLGITLPRTVHEQKLMGTAVPSLAQAQPGDLIVFKGGGHVAIYEGNNTVIHAPYPGRVVSNQKLWVGDSGIETIRRIVPSAGTTAASPTTASTGTTSAAVQAAALATVQAMIQADYGLLSSSPGAGSSLSALGTGTTSSSLSSAISSMAGSLSGTSSTASTGTASSTTAALQALAAQQSILAQEQL
jgi:peptidoglycan DL-endopeptidase CwlO